MNIIIEHNGETVELDRHPLTIKEAQQIAAQSAWSLFKHDNAPATAKVYDDGELVYQVRAK